MRLLQSSRKETPVSEMSLVDGDGQNSIIQGSEPFFFC